MKIAITGKGGVGKSTITAAFALLIAQKGNKVLAVDADPDANLASALGIPGNLQKDIVTIAKQKDLIEERTGAKVKEYGQMFKLNPEVSDIADTYAYNYNGVNLLVLGAIEGGGSGCACPESTLLKALVQDIVLHRNEILLMDMEAGIEHLGRGTARGVDSLLIVVEPGQRAINSVKRIAEMSHEIGIHDIFIVANNIKSIDEEIFIKDSLSGYNIIGLIPYSEELRHNDRDGVSVLDGLNMDVISRFEDMVAKLQKKVVDS